jgi:hypothetical protein
MSVPVSVTYAASFSDDQHGLIQTPHTIHRTPDGAASWQPITSDLSASDLKGFRWARALVALDLKHMVIAPSWPRLGWTPPPLKAFNASAVRSRETSSPTIIRVSRTSNSRYVSA